MATSNLSFQSRYEYQREEVVTRQAVSVTQAAASTGDAALELKAQAGQRIIAQQEVSFQATTEELGLDDAQESISRVEKRFQSMISILERMFGVKISLYDASELEGAGGGQSEPSTNSGSTQGQVRQTAMAMREYHQITEQESSYVGIQGRLELNDGRSLNVDFSLDMSRSRYEEFYGEISFTGRNVDPLVVNLNGNAAQLTNQRVSFDLDGDGVEEQVAFASGDSAFLAIDKNGNGSIDDGSELFGPQSGSGFADLAQYDSNQDGLIDSLDDIWQELVLVQRDEQGNESLLSLSDVGISAFVLERTSSPFSLFNDQGARTGIIRETGLYVKDDGSVDSLQHVDLVV